MNKVAFLRGNDSSTLPIEARYMIVDSGVSYALVPVRDFNALKRELEAIGGVSCIEP